MVLNDDGKETFMRTVKNKVSTSIVDLTICNFSLSNFISDWKVDAGIIVSSDHNAISFNLVNQELTKPAKRTAYGYDTKDADWETFDQKLKDNINLSNLSSEIID